jgi:phosphoribosylanthranilate isomerase
VESSSKTRIKVCGITSPEDGLEVARAGADAIGLNFFPASPRVITIADAKRILAVLPPFITTVGLFVNATDAEVREVLAHVPLDMLQFHGDEDPQFCASFNRPYLKAIKMRADTDLVGMLRAYDTALGILLDAWHETLPGGTGQAFDWTLLDAFDDSERLNHRLILAGGLQPGNVAEAIRKTKPWAVDVSSGVESAPGIKSAELTKQFIKAVRSADGTTG